MNKIMMTFSTKCFLHFPHKIKAIWECFRKNLLEFDWIDQTVRSKQHLNMNSYLTEWTRHCRVHVHTDERVVSICRHVGVISWRGMGDDQVGLLFPLALWLLFLLQAQKAVKWWKHCELLVRCKTFFHTFSIFPHHHAPHFLLWKGLKDGFIGLFVDGPAVCSTLDSRIWNVNDRWPDCHVIWYEFVPLGMISNDCGDLLTLHIVLIWPMTRYL